ncbi:uncharacterized protein LOC123443373 isoform X2 [Hordeum vulgare subsp. vulgare]|uniref:uncharacterized protein LOC123443373 isoform X2 n=1 Tax=Hordeum vulgare subsp. vulgare TaxID=112509 RepID=UPI001D1A392D|nr:uncharacterized protein LOC123443373 isoform X2 [Hordeum vulgare subsp. vulgare]
MPSTESAAGLRTSEFALPDGVLAVLSWDPYEQLDVARRITALAVAGWVTGLECEVARLREGAADREQENVEPWDVESTEVAGPGHAGAPASPHCRHLLRRHRHRHLHLRPLGVGPGGACRAAGRVHQTGNQQGECRFLATFRACSRYSGHPTRIFHEEMSLCNNAGANTLITSARNIWSTRSRSILNEPKSSAIIGSHNVNLHDLAIGRRRFFSRSVMPSSSLWWSPFSSPLHYLSY